MINLLPEKNKIAIKKEYLRRIFVVSNLFGLGTFFIIIVFLLLIIFLTRDRKSEQEFSLFLSKQRIFSEGEGDFSSLISEINSKISFLEKNQKEARELSTIIEKIIIMKSDGIKLISVFFNKGDSGENDEISIAGSSQTRNELINFIETLKKEENFAAVDAPLSNFLKETDINFNIKIKLKDL